MHMRCYYSSFIPQMIVLSWQLKDDGLVPHLPGLVSSNAAILLRLLAHVSSRSNCGVNAFLQGALLVVQGSPMLQAWLVISASLNMPSAKHVGVSPTRVSSLCLRGLFS